MFVSLFFEIMKSNDCCIKKPIFLWELFVIFYYHMRRVDFIINSS